MKTNIIKSFVLLLLITATTFAQSFSADPSDSRNQATFESNAPLEDIVGVSNKVKADVMLNHADITKNPKGKVVVDLTTLKTGIDLRDEHLRSANWLNTEKYPHAEFMLTGISGTSSKTLMDGKAVKATITGNLSIHGKTQKVSAPAELTYYKESAKTKARIAGNLLKVNADFSIKLSDYGVTIPSMVTGKVDENIKVSINYIASDANASNVCNPCGACNPCKMKDMKHGKCNPCAMKKMDHGKCNPCSPCAAKKK